MPTRRNTILGLANVLVGSAAVASGAYSGTAMTPGSSLQVLADPRFPAGGLELRPGRNNAAHVSTDGDDLVISIDIGGPNGDGLNRGAVTRFEELVEIHKLPPGPPVDEIYFEFEVIDDGLDSATDPTTGDIEDALFIAAADVDVPGDGSQNYIQATDEAGAHNDLLSPNQHVPFGIGVDLLSSSISDLPSPDRFSIRLMITAEHLPQGPPGGKNDM